MLAQIEPRQNTVLNTILSIKSSLVERSLELGELLLEAKDREYHLGWGYPTFRSWLEHSSGLDMSERQAYYLMNVVKRSKELGIPRETLHKVKLSKLKVIMSLPAETDSAKILELVGDAEHASLGSVKDAVAVLCGVSYVHKTFKLPSDFMEDVYGMAVEHCRRIAGSDVSDDGTVSDISESRCLELIYADFLSGSDDLLAAEDAEFSDAGSSYCDVFEAGEIQ